jgi:hypothetical protein
MALFNRQNHQTQVPAEIQEYYQTERRERAGVAWLLAIGTLIVTIALTAGIFFAGRWAWRELTTDDPQETAQNEQQGGENQNNQENQPSNEQNQPAQLPSDNQNNTENREEENNSESNNQNENQTNQEENSGEEQPAGGQGGGATPSGEEKKKETAQKKPAASSGGKVAAGATSVPNTGPGDTLAIFIGASVMGYLFHRYLRHAHSR